MAVAEAVLSRHIQVRSLNFHVRLRVAAGRSGIMGPGKASLLEQIRDSGSISAAARALGMSYRRAWVLCEDLNQLFKAPLVETARGGSHGGGAHLTALGDEVLASYRRMEQQALDAIGDEADRLAAQIDPKAVSRQD